MAETKHSQVLPSGTFDQKETLWETLTSCRWTLSYVGCLGMIVLYALRINLGIAMVCMVKAPSNLTDSNRTAATGNCGYAVNDGNNLTKAAISGDIEWDKTTQGWVLGSFFYGYIVTQIPGGYLAGRFGGKRVILIGMIIYGVTTILLPFAARLDGKNYKTSAGLVITLRAIMGVSTGTVIPAMHNLWGKWAPPLERSKLAVTCYSGVMIGTVLMLGVGGYACEWTSFDGGWPSIFYLGGTLCLIYSLLWAFVIFDSPEQHPRISDKEREYIIQSFERRSDITNSSVPWMAMFKSTAMWAIILGHCAYNFGNYTLITKLPAFMKEVLQFDIKQNGLYSTLPYIAQYIVAISCSQLVDKLRQRDILSTGTLRKLCMAIATLIPAAFLIGIGYISCDSRMLGVVCLTLAVAFTAFSRSGYLVNHVDIAPRYAGEMIGITNTFATIPGMIAPSLINAMTPNGTAQEWQRVFYVWASVYALGAVMYSVFAKGQVQKWAIDDTMKDTEEEAANKKRDKDSTAC